MKLYSFDISLNIDISNECVIEDSFKFLKKMNTCCFDKELASVLVPALFVSLREPLRAGTQ